MNQQKLVLGISESLINRVFQKYIEVRLYSKMEYQQPYPSSVPHAILVPHTFTITSMFYGCSMVVECFLMGISVILFAFAAYFKIKNHKLLIDHSGNKLPKKDKQNIICEVVAQKEFNYNQDSSDSEQQQQKQNQNKNSLQSELLGGVLRVYQRRLVYATTFTIPWVICIIFFDADIVVIICGAVFMAFVVLFNMRRMLPEWKITLLVYFLPAVAAIFPYVGGTHTLYAWTQVKDPLKLEV